MRILFALALLAPLIVRAADPECEPRFLRVWDTAVPPPITYTAPKWHVIGLDIADDLIRNAENMDPATSPWWEFTRDPRFQQSARKPGDTPIDAAVRFRFAGDPKREEAQRSAIWLLHHRADGAGLPDPRYFITWKRLGIRAINRLTSRRIFPMGLTDQPSTTVDGVPFNEMQYFEHDDGHVILGERVITGYVDSERVSTSLHLKVQGDYDATVAGLSETERVKYDIGYFMFFREDGVNSAGIMEELRKMKPHPTREDLQKAIAKPYRLYDFDFSNGGLKVKIKNIDDFPVTRFMNPKDLWLDLPPEVREKTKAHPEQSHRIVADFLEESLAKFFSHYFSDAKQIYGVP